MTAVMILKKTAMFFGLGGGGVLLVAVFKLYIEQPSRTASVAVFLPTLF